LFVDVSINRLVIKAQALVCLVLDAQEPVHMRADFPALFEGTFELDRDKRLVLVDPIVDDYVRHEPLTE
jgi:hypothetical protein